MGLNNYYTKRLRRLPKEHTIKMPSTLYKYVSKLNKREYIAIVFTGNISKFSNPLVVGHNGFSSKDTCIYNSVSSNIKSCTSIHAEEDAIIRYKKKYSIKRKRSINLFVGRWNFKYGRPCWNCYQMLINTVKENYNISKIYYTNDSELNIVKTSLFGMIKYPFKVSSFWAITFKPIDSVNVERIGGKILVFVK